MTDEEYTPWRKVQTDVRRWDRGRAASEEGLEYVEVPGGRLYRTWISARNGCSVALAFVPMPKEPERGQATP